MTEITRQQAMTAFEFATDMAEKNKTIADLKDYWQGRADWLASCFAQVFHMEDNEANAYLTKNAGGMVDELLRTLNATR